MKIKSKAFANLVISVLLLLAEAWAWMSTAVIKTQKNAAVQPATFPRIMIIGMAVFTAVLLIQSAVKLMSMKPQDPLAEPAETMNFMKDRGVLAALIVIALCVVYVALFKTLGYVVVSFIISAIIMWMIGVRKPALLISIAVIVPLAMWFIFYKFLSVNIPMGVLQFLRDLVDKI